MPSMPDAERSSLRILCLLDFPTGGSRWLWEYQDEPRDEVDFEISQPIPWLRRISRSLAYIGENGLQAVRAYRRQRRKTYDLVVAWEIKNGLFFAFLRRLFGRRSPKFVILAFAYRGASRRSPGLFKYALKSVAAISVPSQEEATLYASRLDYPVENIHLCPNGAYDLGLLNKLAEQPAANSLEGSEQVVSIHDQPVIFSGGYSHRDFGTLLAAVEGLPARCLLVTPSLDRENAALQSECGVDPPAQPGGVCPPACGSGYCRHPAHRPGVCHRLERPAAGDVCRAGNRHHTQHRHRAVRAAPG